VYKVPRNPVELARWAEIARLLSRERAEALSRFLAIACRGADIALFGSRARGSHHALSDWDIAVVVDDGDYRVENMEFGQVIHIPLSRLGQVLETSMVVLDIAMDGILLCGSGDRWITFIRSVREYVAERGLTRTGIGWVRQPTNRQA